MVVQIPTPATNLRAVGTGPLYVFVSGSPVLVGVSTVEGAAAAAFVFAAPVSGAVTVSGQAATALTFTASAAGTVSHLAAAATAFVFAAPAAGTPTTFGAGSAAFVYAAPAAGLVTVTGSATASFTFTASAAGVPTTFGTGSASLTFTAAAAGTVPFDPASLSPLGWWEPNLDTPGQTLTDLAGTADGTLGADSGTGTDDPDWSDSTKLVFDGVNDEVQLPTGGFPDTDQGDEWTVVVVFNPAASPTADDVIVSTIFFFGFAGFRVLNDSGGTEWAVNYVDSTGAAVELKSANYTYTQGDLVCFACGVDSSDDLWQRLNAQSGATVSASTIGATRTGNTPRLGTLGVTDANFGAFDFYALLTFQRTLSSTELDDLFDHYQTQYG